MYVGPGSSNFLNKDDQTQKKSQAYPVVQVVLLVSQVELQRLIKYVNESRRYFSCAKKKYLVA